MTRVKARFSAAVRSAAWAAATSASAVCSVAWRVSTSCWLVARAASSACERVQLHLGVGERGRGVRLLRLGLVVGGRVGARVDLTKSTWPLLHLLAVLEAERRHIAADPRAQVDAGGQLELADEVVPVLHLPLQRLGDDHQRRRRRGRLGRAARRHEHARGETNPNATGRNHNPPARLLLASVKASSQGAKRAGPGLELASRRAPGSGLGGHHVSFVAERRSRAAQAGASGAGAWRGSPISAGWKSSAETRVQSSEIIKSLPMLAVPGWLREPRGCRSRSRWSAPRRTPPAPGWR